VNWIHLAQDKDQRQVLVNMAMGLWFVYTAGVAVAEVLLAAEGQRCLT
jgi:hypothetical protein